MVEVISLKRMTISLVVDDASAVAQTLQLKATMVGERGSSLVNLFGNPMDPVMFLFCSSVGSFGLLSEVGIRVVRGDVRLWGM